MFARDCTMTRTTRLLHFTLATILMMCLSASQFCTAISRAGERQPRPFNPQVSSSRTNGKIAFVSDRSGANEIFVMNDDGSDQTQLTNDPTRCGNIDPAWSPDGARIAFVSCRGGNRQISLMTADGGGQTRLTDGSADDFRPEWSPDGKRIVFVQGKNTSNQIVVMNADGSGQTAIRSANTAANPVWSPDGTRIAFEESSPSSGSLEIDVMNVDGSNVRQLTFSELFASNSKPSWSPDGTRILFVFVDSFFCSLFGNNCKNGLYVMNTDGNNRQVVTGEETNNPGWSPDNQLIPSIGSFPGATVKSW